MDCAWSSLWLNTSDVTFISQHSSSAHVTAPSCMNVQSTFKTTLWLLEHYKLQPHIALNFYPCDTLTVKQEYNQPLYSNNLHSEMQCCKTVTKSTWTEGFTKQSTGWNEGFLTQHPQNKPVWSSPWILSRQKGWLLHMSRHRPDRCSHCSLEFEALTLLLTLTEIMPIGNIQFLSTYSH